MVLEGKQDCRLVGMMRKGLEPGSRVYLVVYEAEMSRVHAREGKPVAFQLLSKLW